MIRQILNVVEHGLIEEGQVIINADEKTGLIDASETVVVGLGPFATTQKASQELKLDPSLMLSKSIQPGMKWTVGPVKIEIINKSQALIQFVQGDDHLSGKADLDLSGQYLKVLHVNAVGTVHGMDVQLELQHQD